MRNSLPWSRSRGVTLIEVVVSMVLVGILFVVGANMLSGAFSTSNVVVRETLGVGSARYALERIGRELREAQTVLSNSSESFSFVKNNGETFSVSKNGNSVLLGVEGSSQSLADNVNAFGLIYRDINLAITSNPSAIRFVDISLTVIPVDSPDATPGSGPAVSLTTRIALRTPT